MNHHREVGKPGICEHMRIPLSQMPLWKNGDFVRNGTSLTWNLEVNQNQFDKRRVASAHQVLSVPIWKLHLLDFNIIILSILKKIKIKINK